VTQPTRQSRRSVDRYVRPPLVAKEPSSRWAGVWRFRLVALIVLAALALLVLYITRHLINTEQNPTFGGMHASGHTTGQSAVLVLTL
jgi:hypothetical protein